MDNAIEIKANSQEQMELAQEFLTKKLKGLIKTAVEERPKGNIIAWMKEQSPEKYAPLFDDKDMAHQIQSAFILFVTMAMEKGGSVDGLELGSVSPYRSNPKNLDPDSTLWRFANIGEHYHNAIQTLWEAQNTHRFLENVPDDIPEEMQRRLKDMLSRQHGDSHTEKLLDEMMVAFVSTVFEIPNNTVRHDLLVMEYEYSLDQLRKEVE